MGPTITRRLWSLAGVVAVCWALGLLTWHLPVILGGVALGSWCVGTLVRLGLPGTHEIAPAVPTGKAGAIVVVR